MEEDEVFEQDEDAVEEAAVEDSRNTSCTLWKFHGFSLDLVCNDISNCPPPSIVFLFTQSPLPPSLWVAVGISNSIFTPNSLRSKCHPNPSPTL